MLEQGYDSALIEAAASYSEVKEMKNLKLARYIKVICSKLEETQAEYEKVVALGGLHVIGTERHESRRIDNQLRGRAGRQGDPGSSQFYISLEDELMRLLVRKILWV